MAEDNDIQQGATSDQQQGGEDNQPKTYSQEDLDKLIEETKKQAASEGYRLGQSHKDKEIAEMKRQWGETETQYEKRLAEREKQDFDKMSPEEQDRYMVRKVYEKMYGSGENSSDSKTDSSPTNRTDDGRVSDPGDDDSQSQVKETVNSVIKEMGLDPAKLDWGEDAKDPADALKRFVKSIASQQNASQGNEKQDADDDDTEASRVSRSRSSAATKDIKDVDPLELIREGYAESGQHRGRQ